MNDKQTENIHEILNKVFTRPAGKKIVYVGCFYNTATGMNSQYDLRRSDVRYGFVAVHRYSYNDGGPLQGFSFHARLRDLAINASQHEKDAVIKIVEVDHLTDVTAHDRIRPKARDMLERIEQYRGEKSLELQASEAHLREYLKGALYHPEAIEAQIEVAEKYLESLERAPAQPEKFEEAHNIRNRAAAALDATNGFDWQADTLFVRERLAHYLDGLSFEPKLEAVLEDVIELERVAGKIMDACPGLTAAEMDARIRRALLKDGLIKVNGEPSLSGTTLAEEDTFKRISAEARALADQWIEECLYELNLRIALRHISQGERDVLKGILEQVRAGRGA